MNTRDFHTVRTIVTHPGQAHRDDFMSVCVALALSPVAPVFRREPDTVDLGDPQTIVIDVGRRYEPAGMNFDHHQFERDHEPVCALTLILDRLGILKQARKALAWLEFTEMIDSKGPLVTSTWLSMTDTALHTTLSPVETHVLSSFQQFSQIVPGQFGGLHELMGSIGHNLLAYISRFHERYEKLSKFVVVRRIELEGKQFLTIVDASFLTRTEEPTLALERWVIDNLPTAAVTITEDDRGDGKSLYRRNDHPRVDFSRLEGKPGIVFAHKNGFIAKTAYDTDPMDAILQAVKPA